MTIARTVRLPTIGAFLTPRVALLTAFVLAALIVGCAAPEPTATPVPPPPAATATPATQAPAATPAATTAQTVDIQLTEWDVVANPPAVAARQPVGGLTHPQSI